MRRPGFRDGWLALKLYELRREDELREPFPRVAHRRADPRRFLGRGGSGRRSLGHGLSYHGSSYG